MTFALAGPQRAPAQQPAPNRPLRRLGLKPLTLAQYMAVTPAISPTHFRLGPAVDLSAGMPPVGDQGSQDSCSTWAAVYAVRTYLERAELRWDVRTPAYQFSPAFVYNQLVRGNCGVGVSLPDAFGVLINQGAATLAAMPYNLNECGAQPGPLAMQAAAPYRIAGYRRLNQQDPNEVKANLAAGYPVIVAVEVDDGFQNLGRDQYWGTHGPGTGYHAIALVGYDDSRHVFKLINSWGSGWGTDGYGFISYDLFPSVVREAYIIEPFHNHQAPAGQPQIAASASLSIIGMQSAAGAVPGLNVHVQFTANGYAGHSGQVALHFFYSNGQTVKATRTDYMDIYGNAAAAQSIAINQNSNASADYWQFVPVAALNIPAGQYVWNGTQWVLQGSALLVRADLFIDNFGVAQSGAYAFTAWR